MSETHEPEVPENWPDGHVGVELTDDTAQECFAVRVHGAVHYLHATTASELRKMLSVKLEEYNQFAREHGVPEV